MCYFLRKYYIFEILLLLILFFLNSLNFSCSLFFAFSTAQRHIFLVRKNRTVLENQKKLCERQDHQIANFFFSYFFFSFLCLGLKHRIFVQSSPSTLAQLWVRGFS